MATLYLLYSLKDCHETWLKYTAHLDSVQKAQGSHASSRSIFHLEVKFLSLYFIVNSVFSVPFEGFSFNFDILISLFRQCEGGIKQLPT